MSRGGWLGAFGISDAGFLEVPSEDAVSRFLGTDRWVYTPRFLIRQGPTGKPRAIDDCKHSGLNNTDLDYVLSIAALLGKTPVPGGQVSFRLSDGTCLEAPIALDGEVPWQDSGFEQGLQTIICSA